MPASHDRKKYRSNFECDSCSGVEGLQRAILARPELFASAFTEKLLTYALGRGVEYYDAPAVRKITADTRTKDYRFSSFILGIVASTPFQQRRSQ